MQQQEWAAFSIDPAAPTPVVDALAVARGITTANYMALTGAKVAWQAGILGAKYAAADAIKVAITKAEVDAVSLPVLV